MTRCVFLCIGTTLFDDSRALCLRSLRFEEGSGGVHDIWTRRISKRPSHLDLCTDWFSKTPWELMLNLISGEYTDALMLITWITTIVLCWWIHRCQDHSSITTLYCIQPNKFICCHNCFCMKFKYLHFVTVHWKPNLDNI